MTWLASLTSARRSELILVAASAVAALAARDVTGDLALFVGISEQLTTSSALFVYADHPNTQSGPLSLIAIRGIDAVGLALFPIVVCLLGMFTIVVVSRTRATPARAKLQFLVGGVALAFWWPYLKTSGHLDDALVLTLIAVCFWLVTRDRYVWAGAVLGVTLAVKPWAVFLLPILVRPDERNLRRLAAPLVTAIVVGSVLWSPFLLATTATLDGLRPTVRLAPDSTLRLFGFDSTSVPSVLRHAQLGLALVAVAAVTLWRGRLAGALVAGVAVRMALDPGTWNYYTVGFLLGALLWDMSQDQRLPWLTLTACVLLPPTWLIEDPDVRALGRLTACIIALAVVLWPERGQSARAESKSHAELRSNQVGSIGDVSSSCRNATSVGAGSPSDHASATMTRS